MRSTKLLLSVLASLAISACRPTTAQNESAVKDSQQPQRNLDGGWSCAGSPTSFGIESFIMGRFRGHLRTGATDVVFNCAKLPTPRPATDGSGEALVWDCSLTPGQTGVEGVAVGAVKLQNGSLAVHVTQPNTPAATLACVDNTPQNVVVPTFAEVEHILKTKCSSCHSQDGGQEPFFSTVEEVKPLRQALATALDSGFMPFQQRNWRNTPDGQKLLTWFRQGAELQ